MNTKTFTLTVVLLCAIVPVFNADALTPLTGDEIAQMVYNRDDGEDSYSKIEMILIDKNGNERVRSLITHTKDYGELRKNFVRFFSPADIEETGFLSWENEAGDDTQYLYLPDLGRSRRIVSSQKDLRFVNTDFTYEDMQRRRPEKDSHKLLKEEKWHGYSCYVVEYTPKEKKSSQYAKTVQWIEKESLIPVKVEFYNKKGKIFKELKVAKLEKVNGIWTSMDMLMDDFSEKHKTRMRVLEVLYNRGMDDEVFTLQNMEDY
ncbi:MAG: outer membrane lipoprotein-sorting protein [Omnitrophica bacterium]|nr:outer membrane lipoprotein-sorting protein [Candidatus Omnitrophota bacterium]